LFQSLASLYWVKVEQMEYRADLLVEALGLLSLVAALEDLEASIDCWFRTSVGQVPEGNYTIENVARSRRKAVMRA